MNYHSMIYNWINMKIVLIFDSGLAGAGGKSNSDCALTATREVVGTAMILEPYFKQIGGQISATLYCGMDYYKNNKDEVVMKMTAMVKKLKPDFVLCGPCFNFADYSEMAARCTKLIMEKTDVKVASMMAIENQDVIAKYREDIAILKMPKKGGTGLSESFDVLVKYIDTAVKHPENLAELKSKNCY
ncbi:MULTISPECIES: GrdB-related putative oxidoreductase [Terrabacteria group]|uniref:GrdB-related putative oxidoreductase n=1 Tax=Bacillati TaxID=1783272 RepID=UPI001C6ED2A8|nr:MULTISPECIES: GrdB-related putative oxidoreductase [Terrabacteria group]MBW9212893.1 glycine/betaine/sarcosine/D-proline family reductase selenoprotein B [Trueperella sp. zg.1013]